MGDRPARPDLFSLEIDPLNRKLFDIGAPFFRLRQFFGNGPPRLSDQAIDVAPGKPQNPRDLMGWPVMH